MLSVPNTITQKEKINDNQRKARARWLARTRTEEPTEIAVTASGNKCFATRTRSSVPPSLLSKSSSSGNKSNFPQNQLSLSSLLWAVFTGVFFYISQSSPIRQLSWFCVGSFSISFKIWLWWIFAQCGWFEHSNDVVWKLCEEIVFCRTVDSSSTRMSGDAGGYQCSDDNAVMTKIMTMSMIMIAMMMMTTRYGRWWWRQRSLMRKFRLGRDTAWSFGTITVLVSISFSHVCQTSAICLTIPNTGDNLGGDCDNSHARNCLPPPGKHNCFQDWQASKMKRTILVKILFHQITVEPDQLPHPSWLVGWEPGGPGRSRSDHERGSEGGGRAGDVHHHGARSSHGRDGVHHGDVPTTGGAPSTWWAGWQDHHRPASHLRLHLSRRAGLQEKLFSLVSQSTGAATRLQHGEGGCCQHGAGAGGWKRPNQVPSWHVRSPTYLSNSRADPWSPIPQRVPSFSGGKSRGKQGG